MPPLPSLAALVSERTSPEDDVVTLDRWYLRRSQPCFARSGELSGVVITFLDVTRLKSSDLAEPPDRALRAITDGLPQIISFVDEALERY